MASNTMSALLSGMSGPLGGLGKEQMRQAKIQELKDIAARGGATEQTNLFANGVQDSARVGQHLFANGRQEAFPFLGQEQSFQNQRATQAQSFQNAQSLQGTAHNNAMARQLDQQAFVTQTNTQSQQNLMQSAQQTQMANYMNPQPQTQNDAFYANLDEGRALQAKYTAVENVRDKVATYGTVMKTEPGRAAEVAQDMNAVILASRSDEALTDREYETQSQALFGFEGIQNRAMLVNYVSAGIDQLAVKGATQQYMARTAIELKSKSQDLNAMGRVDHRWGKDAAAFTQSLDPDIMAANTDVVRSEREGKRINQGQKLGILDRYGNHISGPSDGR
jgi:hypothetical protein